MTLLSSETGQAGPSLAARCAEEGLDTAIIERGQYGGTCVNTGCTPTKAKVASARAAHMANRMSDFGIDIEGSISVDMEKGEIKGFMKILVNANTEKILAAAILGIEGDEIIHSIIDMMYADKPYTTIRDAVHIHPTVSELIPTMLENLEPLN